MEKSFVTEMINNRRKYLIMPGSNDLMIEAIINNEYKSDFALIPPSIAQKNSDKLIQHKYMDIVIQISSPFRGTGINFYIIHFTKDKPKKMLTGIFHGLVCEKTYKFSAYAWETSLELTGEYTEDFKDLINNILLFMENKEITREDLDINNYEEFDEKYLNPLYYTKQAKKIRDELQEKDYLLLSEIADIVSTPTDKDIDAKYIDSKSFSYPLVYSSLAKTKIKKATKVTKGDIICLLIGEIPKFYLYNEDYDDIYIKSGNYCIIRCKKEEYRAYLINYLNDEKARLYFMTNKRGCYIPNLTKSDLMNLKVIIPTKEMMETAEKTQEYIMNQKRLSPFEINELIRASYSNKVKNESQKMINEDLISKISIIKIEVLKELINNDLDEVNVCFKNGAYKSAIILCGSILEAVLLDWLSEYENTDEVSDIGVEKNGRDMELAKIIVRLREIIKPEWYESKKAHEIRETRNMVHPKECIRNNKKVTVEECERIIEDLKEILESKEKRHN